MYRTNCFILSFQVNSQVTALASILSVGREQVGALLAAKPDLIDADPSTLDDAVEDLSNALAMPYDQVQR